MNNIYLSNGNKKLKPSEDTNFLIFNLPAIKSCPFATEHCRKYCYARKAEKVYPDVLPARERNFKASQEKSFVDDMITLIMAKREKQHKKTLVVRIHESGDFYNKEYANKWLEIARRCKGVTFMAYTKSFKYFDGVKLPRNFVLRASIWDDTTKEQKEIVTRNNWAIYTAVQQFTENDSFTRCRCSDCATCGKCWKKSEKDIRCEIH